jgi:hypothetical protein
MVFWASGGERGGRRVERALGRDGRCPGAGRRAGATACSAPCAAAGGAGACPCRGRSVSSGAGQVRSRAEKSWGGCILNFGRQTTHEQEGKKTKDFSLFRKRGIKGKLDPL